MDTRTGFHIGTIAGIPIRIHFTFLLILPFLALAFGQRFTAAAELADVPPRALGGPPFLWGLGLALALFGSVLLHELAHSLYALREGGRVRGITLLMIGGISEMSEPMRHPGKEAVMALVGPVTSLAIGALALLLFWTAGDVRWFNVRFGVFYFAQLNLFLGLFNLLPAFPMDGGRILRGVLARRLGLVRATQIAATVGKAFAVLFAIAGFLGANVLLLVIAFFVYVGAEGESRYVLARTVLGDLRVREVMTPRAESVAPDDSLAAVADRMLRERRLVFPVVQDRGVVGMVTLDAIQRVPPERRSESAARDAMTPTRCVTPSETVRDALRSFGRDAGAQLCVVDGDRVVGMLSQLDVLRALKLRELDESQRRAREWFPRRDGEVRV
jgi:Zn-dependent protease/CBS domain-containing protein